MKSTCWKISLAAFISGFFVLSAAQACDIEVENPNTFLAFQGVKNTSMLTSYSASIPVEVQKRPPSSGSNRVFNKKAKVFSLFAALRLYNMRSKQGPG